MALITEIAGVAGASLLAILLVVAVPRASVAAVPSVAHAGSRIAVDVDGNFNDPDDWAATPATLAILARRGLQARLVHYSYNNSLGSTANDPHMQAEMTGAAVQGLQRFGFDPAEFYDLQRNLSGGIGNLRKECDASSETNPLYIIAGGPMEFLWRTLEASDPAKRRYVTVISHSPWNNERLWPPAMTHDWRDVQALGVKWVQIADQNRLFHTKDSWIPYRYLRNSVHPGLRLVWERMMISGKPDISDAGMAYYLVTGDQGGTPDDLRRFMGSWAGTGGYQPPLTTTQAESGKIRKGVIARAHAGYLGTGFVDYGDTADAYVEVTVKASKAGLGTLSFRYANGTATNKALRILVNGKTVSDGLAFGSTRYWSRWGVSTLRTQLRAGDNTIRAQAATAAGGPNLDQVVVSMH